MTLGHFLGMHRVIMKARRVRRLRRGWDAEATHWQILLESHHDRKEKFTFSMGSAHGDQSPPIKLVLQALCSDVEGVNGRRFTDWASDMGLDPDSIRSLRTFRACQANWKKLSRLFGGDAALKQLCELVRE